MFTTVQPIASAELITSMLFSCIKKAFNRPLLIVRSSMVFGGRQVNHFTEINRITYQV